MKKIAVNLVVVAALLILAVAPVAAAGHETIVDVAVADGRFTTLVAAVQAAGLVDTLSGGEWTVFAPTDDAFEKLGLNADNVSSAFSTDELTDILLYHVLAGEVTSAKAKTVLGDITMANGEIAGLKFFDGSLYVNDGSRVIIPDVVASNGVIHAVDTVILGPWPRTEEEPEAEPAAPTGPTIVDIAVADGRFTTLVAAVQAAGLVDTLGGGEWTVFAPTDDAFGKLGLNADNVGSAFSTAELTDILLYHVLAGEVTSAKAKTVLGDITMANGEIAGLKFVDGSLYVNDDAKVIIPDVVASNGVIHAVDTVILGPWPRMEEAGMEGGAGGPTVSEGSTIVEIAVADGRFETLVAAVTYAGLADTLSGGEWTVFAPTDDAFEKLGLNADNISGAFSKEELTDILLYHVLEGEVTSAKAKTVLGDITMANGEIAGLKFFDGSLYVNDDAKVIVEDVVASNGVIHAVDTVILGPWPRE